MIPAYNAEQTLTRAVDSVLAQTRRPDEVIVVNDGSRDRTAEVASRFGEPVRLIDQCNGGAASARNAALDAATGDLIAFLDADDYWETDKLARQVAHFEQEPELALLAGRYYTQQPGGERRVSGAPAGFREDQSVRLCGARALEFAMHVWTGAAMIRRATLANERFVSGLEPAEDRDLWIRIVLRGPVRLMSEPLATAVLEPDSLSRSNVARDCGNMLRVIHRHRDAIPLLTRMKWASHTHYRWAACTTDVGTGWRQLLQSIVRWPIPYQRRDVTMPFARARVLKRLLWRSLSPPQSDGLAVGSS